jgi:alginate O-acetyltransferase complex protein AlgI
MVFHQSNFLGFFAVVFAVYWLLGRHRHRLLWLTAASAFFYASAKFWPILVLFASTSIDYLVALRLERTASPRVRKALVALSVCTNLGVLAGFKYFVFAWESTSAAAGWLGFYIPPPVIKFFLPLGISFYTFEAISYVVEVYKGKLKAVRNPLDYALYILFFPHLVAGPVVRPTEFLPQIARPKRFDWARVQMGAQQFLVGLFKKTVIADQVATCIDPVFKDPAAYGSAALWLAVLGYAVQIYCDFSGYTDMALGLAQTFGFRLPNNFNAPYLASSPADFWKRWHISLSRWLRDYLYIPLGGNRLGPSRTMVNLFLTMLLGGLWHGANWTFVVWGAYHGLLLAVQRLIPESWDRPAFRPLTTVFTFLAVCVGWVFFRAQTLGDAGTILRGLVVPASGYELDSDGTLIVLTAVMTVFLGHAIGRWKGLPWVLMRSPAVVSGFVLALGMTLALLLMKGEGGTFIYFQF